MQDILRIWSQALTPSETAIWNEVSQRDLSKDISLKSGLRTPKCVIDREIKKYKLSAGKKAALSQTLKNIPDHFLPAPTPQAELSDPSDILETKPNPLLLPEEPPAMSYIDADFISNYSELLSKIQEEKPWEQNIQLNKPYITLKNECSKIFLCHTCRPRPYD